MDFGRCLIVLLLLLLASTSIAADEPAAAPQWIWTPQRGTTGRLVFEKSFHVDAAPQQAELHIAGDFCSVAVTLNGEQVLTLEDYSPIARIDVTQFVVPGENIMQLAAIASEGPPAIAVSLDLTLPEGTAAHILSDDTWQMQSSRPRTAKALGTIFPEMWGIGSRSIQISPFDNYEQWRQALGAEPGSERYWTVPGFEIELVRAAAPEEGSWVALAFDPQGRVTIAREDRGLLRMSFDAPGGSVNSVETIDDTLLECRGLLYVGDDLYANANNLKGTYRLRDADGDGKLDAPELLREFPGTVGHGRNQLAAGTDGRIYSICGDAVELPTGIFDRTSPIRQITRPPGALEGFVVAFDPESNEWELCSAGTRNPFGIAFNRDGEAFTYDADAEFDTGAPWYRPTRLLHLVSGADYGWRSVTGQWPPYDPDRADNALPLLDIGKGSPTAVDFGYDSRFPPRYRDALYILDWAYGRVLAVHLKPRGAGYVAEAEMFLQGLPLNVCGLDFGPDGAMYLVTGGRSTKSGLYRVRWTGDETAGAESEARTPDAAAHSADHELQVAAFSAKQRELRRQLEQFHGRQDAEAIAAAWPHLDSADPVLRYAARTAVEHQPVESWKDQALGERRITASLTALIALARGADVFDINDIVERAGLWNFSQLSTSQQLTQLQVFELCLQTDPASVNRQRDPILDLLERRFPVEWGATVALSPMGDGARVNRELARLLVALQAPTALDKSLVQLKSASNQVDRLHYLYLLRDVHDGWTMEGHRAYFAALQSTGQFQAGDGMPGFLQAVRDAATARLNDEERAALALDEPAPPDMPVPQESRPVIQQWTLELLADSAALDPASGDAEQGAKVFEDALCARCHRVGATGPAVGPDLTYVGRRFTRRDMLQSILTPSQVVAENYRNIEVVTTDGRVITGRPVLSGDYRLPVLRIATNPLQPTQVEEIPKDQVDLHRLAESSPMPNGLLDGFTPDEIADLLAYLQRGQALMQQ